MKILRFDYEGHISLNNWTKYQTYYMNRYESMLKNDRQKGFKLTPIDIPPLFVWQHSIIRVNRRWRTDGSFDIHSIVEIVDVAGSPSSLPPINDMTCWIRILKHRLRDGKRRCT
jgi:hypothetical protein